MVRAASQAFDSQYFDFLLAKGTGPVRSNRSYPCTAGGVKNTRFVQNKIHECCSAACGSACVYPQPDWDLVVEPDPTLPGQEIRWFTPSSRGGVTLFLVLLPHFAFNVYN
jgi:hypothetical protein